MPSFLCLNNIFWLEYIFLFFSNVSCEKKLLKKLNQRSKICLILQRNYRLSFLCGNKWRTISLSLKQLRYSVSFLSRRRAMFVEARGALVKIKEIYLRNLSGSRELAFCDRVSSSRAIVVAVARAVARAVDITDLVDTGSTVPRRMAI